jgi:phosphoesterase RecJ-like protein
MSLKKLVASIKRNKYFLITTHTNPEGDALGSELAFYRLLKMMGKRALIVNDDKLPCAYNFLPGINKIKKFKTKHGAIKFDCFIILDCSDLRRCGETYKINIYNKPIINIDHHISNERFGDINWVEPYASSTSEMIYKIYKKLRIPLDRKAALSLYVGIITDTGSFRYSNTAALTHKIAAELIKFKLDVPRIYKNIYENIPFPDMKLLNKILSNVKRQFHGKIAWFQIEQSLLKDRIIAIDLTEHILSFARAIKDVEVAVLFKENFRGKRQVRVNLRSQGKIDVNRIARFFGGGGHKTASGCTVEGRIEDVTRKVLKKIRESFNEGYMRS